MDQRRGDDEADSLPTSRSRSVAIVHLAAQFPAGPRRRGPIAAPAASTGSAKRMQFDPALSRWTTTTRLVVGRETAASPGPWESRCSSKSVSRCSSAASEAKQQPQPSDPVLADLRADDQSKRSRPHIARRGRAWGHQSRRPRRADAIQKAGVRRRDTGRVVRHGLSCLAATGGRLLRPAMHQRGRLCRREPPRCCFSTASAGPSVPGAIVRARPSA
jgi:hypothetical protein